MHDLVNSADIVEIETPRTMILMTNYEAEDMWSIQIKLTHQMTSTSRQQSVTKKSKSNRHPLLLIYNVEMPIPNRAMAKSSRWKK